MNSSGQNSFAFILALMANSVDIGQIEEAVRSVEDLTLGEDIPEELLGLEPGSEQALSLSRYARSVVRRVAD